MIDVTTLSFNLHAYTITHVELNKKTIEANYFELELYIVCNKYVNMKLAIACVHNV